MGEGRDCLICGHALWYGQQKYCSRTCYGQARRQRQTLACTRCGAAIELPPHRARARKRILCTTCAPRTPRAPQAERPGSVRLECFQCGTPVWRYKSRAKRSLYTFCSRDCRLLGWGALRRAWDSIRG